MALKVEVEKLEDVPEAARGFYKASGEKFRLDAEIEDTTGLKSALRKERDENKDAKAALQALKDAGATVDEIAEWKAAKEKGTSAGDLEAKRIQKKHDDELKAARDEKDAALRQLDDELVEARATRALAEFKGSPDLLLHIVRKETKVVMEDGKRVVRVIDADGDVRKIDSKPMTITQLVKEMSEREALFGAFEGTGASGSGARKRTGGGSAHGVKSLKDLTTAAMRSQFITDHGLAAFKALPKA